MITRIGFESLTNEGIKGKILNGKNMIDRKWIDKEHISHLLPENNEHVTPDTSNFLDLSRLPEHITKGESSTIEISIDAEYFRPKFDEILRKPFDYSNEINEHSVEILVTQLIECLKNPEEK